MTWNVYMEAESYAVVHVKGDENYNDDKSDQADEGEMGDKRRQGREVSCLLASVRTALLHK